MRDGPGRAVDGGGQCARTRVCVCACVRVRVWWGLRRLMVALQICYYYAARRRGHLAPEPEGGKRLDAEAEATVVIAVDRTDTNVRSLGMYKERGRRKVLCKRLAPLAPRRHELDHVEAVHCKVGPGGGAGRMVFGFEMSMAPREC